MLASGRVYTAHGGTASPSTSPRLLVLMCSALSYVDLCAALLALLEAASPLLWGMDVETAQQATPCSLA